jgi:hypothetical protein
MTTSHEGGISGGTFVIWTREVRGASSGDQTEFAGATYRFRPVGRGDLVEDVAEMFLDRFERHNQLVGDVTITLPRCQKGEYLELPLGQRLDQPPRRRPAVTLAPDRKSE